MLKKIDPSKALRRSAWVSAREREAVINHLLDTVTRVWVDQDDGKEDRRQLDLEFVDAAALLADIGLEVVPAPRVELSLPSEDLRRICTRLGEQAADGEVVPPEQARLVAQMCDRVLGGL